MASFLMTWTGSGCFAYMLMNIIKFERLNPYYLTRCRTDPEAVEILASDIQRLNPLEFLNDTIIDFYIKYEHHNLNLTEAISTVSLP